ncbi:MAG: hypothetical protein OXF32_06840 [Anaerolineaceae bacterium]|nr:hypothetical protein [Anaerolineaceae bacterium]
MHPYGTNENRRNIQWVLAVLSILIGEPIAIPFRTEVLSIVDTLGVPQFIFWPVTGILSPLSLFGIFYIAFDRYVWKCKLIRRLGIVKTPDLQGKWRGHLKSSYDEFKTEYSIELNISQTWTRISVDLKASKSSSESQTASLVLRGNRQPALIYTYDNNPKGDAIDTMNKHSGTTVLTLEGDSRLTGEYYTGRGRMNHGTMELQRC